MEIRRKVFSLLEDESGEEKLFSTNEFELQEQKNEKLFSTGNEELDDILEEVYYSGISDGYEYAQKEFNQNDSNKSTGEKIGKAGMIAGGATAAAGTGAYLYGRNLIKKNIDHSIAQEAARYSGKGVSEAVANGAKKFWKGTKVGRGGVIAGLGGAGLAAIGAGTYLISRKKRKNKEKLDNNISG